MVHHRINENQVIFGREQRAEECIHTCTYIYTYGMMVRACLHVYVETKRTQTKTRKVKKKKKTKNILRRDEEKKDEAEKNQKNQKKKMMMINSKMRK